MSAVDPSVFTRTSLDERIYAICGGTELVPIVLLPCILPIALKTIRNQLTKGTFQFDVVRFNNKTCVRTADLVRFIETGSSVQKKIGRKTDLERHARIKREGRQT